MMLLFKIIVGFIALEHLYFLVLEMFLWTSPRGIKAFALKDQKFAEATKVLAANQGLYNGFLAAGLIWSLLNNEIRIGLFFLICIAIAGIYGAYSTKKVQLFYIQAIPAIFAVLIFLII